MKTIRQYVTFKVSPQDVYEAIMDSKKHSEFTKSEAYVSREINGEFSVYSGDIQGFNLDLVPGKRIIQSWRYSDWPDGHYPKVTFTLEEIPSGTRLTFNQTGVPDESYDDIEQGWHDYYWEPM